MKITPVKDYKKPVFAIGIATAMALSVSACRNPVVQLEGEATTAGTTEIVELGGDVAIETTAETTEELQIAGEFIIDSTDGTCESTEESSTTTTEVVRLDGDVAVAD